MSNWIENERFDKLGKRRWMGIYRIRRDIIVLLYSTDVILDSIKSTYLNHDNEAEVDRVNLLFDVLDSSISVIILLIAVLVLLYKSGFSLTPLLAGSGIVGLVIGVGATEMIKDYVNGINILLEDQYRPNETVIIDGIKGTVVKLGIRSTVIKDSYGTVYYIPNGKITKVGNYTRKEKNI
jgi:moderate conductance mechanosensitive channel